MSSFFFPRPVPTGIWEIPTGTKHGLVLFEWLSAFLLDSFLYILILHHSLPHNSKSPHIKIPSPSKSLHFITSTHIHKPTNILSSLTHLTMARGEREGRQGERRTKGHHDANANPNAGASSSSQVIRARNPTFPDVQFISRDQFERFDYFVKRGCTMTRYPDVEALTELGILDMFTDLMTRCGFQNWVDMWFYTDPCLTYEFLSSVSPSLVDGELALFLE